MAVTFLAVTFLAVTFLAGDFLAAPLVAVLALFVRTACALPVWLFVWVLLLIVAVDPPVEDLPLVAVACLPAPDFVTTVFLAVAGFPAAALSVLFAAALAALAGLAVAVAVAVAVAAALVLLRFLPPKADSQPDAYASLEPTRVIVIAEPCD